MSPLLLLVAAATLGVEVGWEPLPDGGHEYTIGIEPQLLDMLRDGTDIISEVPPHIHVRRYRITVGSGKLNRIDGERQAANARQGSTDIESAGTEPAVSSPLESEPEPADVSQVGPTSEAPRFAPPPAEVARAETQHDLASEPHHGASLESKDEKRVEPASGPPAMLSASSDDLKPIGGQKASYQDPAEVQAEKPQLDPGKSVEPSRPWLPLLIAVVMLCGSLGGNAYLGWIAWDARSRYRAALSRFRAAPAA